MAVVQCGSGEISAQSGTLSRYAAVTHCFFPGRSLSFEVQQVELFSFDLQYLDGWRIYHVEVFRECLLLSCTSPEVPYYLRIIQLTQGYQTAYCNLSKAWSRIASRRLYLLAFFDSSR
jgi:hypothetical protein